MPSPYAPARRLRRRGEACLARDPFVKRLSHYDDSGDVRMVDVGEKAPTRRTAKARAFVVLSEEVLAKLAEEPMVVEILDPSGEKVQVPVGPFGLRHILRLTSPWRFDTAFARRLVLQRGRPAWTCSSLTTSA